MDNKRELDSYFRNNLIGKLSTEEIEILKEYTMQPYEKHSISLSTSISNYQEKRIYTLNKDYLDHSIDCIRKCIRLSPLPTSLTVYHGGDIDAIKGDIINTNTFLSTSLYKSIAESFMHTSLLEINLPINYPALWMKPFSIYPLESEILLMDNSLFEVVSTKKVGGHKELKLVPINYEKDRNN